ncbi:Major facilitator superfamily domain-containing protein [Lachnellula occidentalis]|uniref:Lysosomal dipeptide transporter MFSD1 n=1 Tax=Lachnellula occidentalis TaxID=215460 RepID=A0A8H8RU94_9HELO|nr:Major facilitator superfamily domain-containing protein [Lachnellula occidentalis]
MIGIGGEIPSVIASDIVTRWFHEEHLALALATLLGLSRLGSVATSILTPRLTSAHGVIFASWASTIIALLVSVPCVIYVLANDAAQSSSGTQSESRFKDSLKRFPRIFWLLGIICIAFYGCYGPFNNSAIRFIASRFYNDDQEVAGIAVSIPNVLSGILVLPFGLLLEHPRFKFYPLSLLFSSALIVVAHALFMVQIGGAIFPLCLLGVAYALFGVAFWPSVACSILQDSSTSLLPLPLLDDNDRTDELEESLIARLQEPVDDSSPLVDRERGHIDGDREDRDEDSEVTERVGTNEDLVVIGYGILTSFLNLSMGIVPVVLAVMEVWAGYSGLEMVFVGLSVFALSASARLINIWRD